MKKETKYWPLHNYLNTHEDDEITLSFTKIEEILGSELPPSAYKSRSWWSNRRKGSWQSPTWMDAGYHVDKFDLTVGEVTFQKPIQQYKVKRQDGAVLWDPDSIKILRRHMDMSQAQFADDLGVRQQTISEWERGMYAPGRAMSKYLNMVAEKVDFTYGQET
ncbi:helix-turn-helix transcriptional regulator [Anaerolineales bacterium HSG6]|nr:helix-turn-helix transcriptional regulator [Anaerolineales bacterium HSG6]MDM8531866.1 helix-turn-helix transcriptional regulator [Anaerolineales bacterium HSG25]